MDQGEVMGDAWKYDPDYIRATEFFGIGMDDREDLEVAKKISVIKDWTAEQRELKIAQESLENIYELKRRLGIHTTGKTLLNELYQYVRLSPKRMKYTPEKEEK